MPTLIEQPSVIESVGTKPKRIEEYIGRVNSGDDALSVARMVSPAGWEEPAQTPQFDEYTIVLRGALRVEFDRPGGGGSDALTVRAGQAVIARAGERVRYSTPEEGAEYIAVCSPAFSPDTVRRDQ
jgi:mannose-6-phosphate isomerase-like protein (cupin superfamily)